MHRDPANTPHFQPPSRIFNLLRQTSAELAQLQLLCSNFSRTGVTSKEVRLFQPDLRFSGFLHRQQIASRHLQPDRYQSNALAGFPVRRAHLQPNSDFSAGIGFGAPICMPLRLLSSISSGTYLQSAGSSYRPPSCCCRDWASSRCMFSVGRSSRAMYRRRPASSCSSYAVLECVIEENFRASGGFKRRISVDCRATWAFDRDTRTMVWNLFLNAPASLGYDPRIVPAWESPTCDAFAVI